MKRENAIEYVSMIIDDALGAYSPDSEFAQHPDRTGIVDSDTLIGWQCGFEPMFIAVRSYLPGVVIDWEEAEDLAIDYLTEKKWFSPDRLEREADYIFEGKQGDYYAGNYRDYHG